MKIFLLYVAIVFAGVSAPNPRVPKKYYVYKEKVNWYTAYENCQQKGQQLATMENCWESYDLKKTIQVETMYQRAWTSGASFTNENYTWVVTGQVFEYNAFTADDKEVNTCVSILPSKTAKHMDWTTNDCNDELFYVCQNQRPCPESSKN